MKTFFKFLIATVLFFALAQAAFGQTYRELDKYTTGTKEEISQYLFQDSNNCFEEKDGRITSINYFKQAKKIRNCV